MTVSLPPPRLVLVAVVVLATVVAGAASAADQQSIPEERPTEDVTQRLTVDVDPESTTGTFRVFIAYPARTAGEADAAKNESLDPAWFRGDERIQEIYDAHADDGDELPEGSLSVRHEQSLSGRSPSDPEHGWIILQYETAWYEFVDPGETLTIDSAYVNALDRGWELQVITPSSWEPETVDGDPVVEPSGQTATSYRWDVGSDLPETLLAFDSPVTTTTTETTTPFGIAGGIISTTVALLLVVGFQHWRRT